MSSNGGTDSLITPLASVDEKKQPFVFWSTQRHLVVTKTLNIHISETSGPNSNFLLRFLQSITHLKIIKIWEYG